MEKLLKQAFRLIISIAIPLSAGFSGSFFTVSAINSWYAELAKPALNPPNWVFGPVWTILYILIGASLFLVWKKDWVVSNHVFKKEKKAWNRWSERLWTGDLQKFNTISVFGIQYVLNVSWSFVFFALKMPMLAFFVILALWVSIVYLIINFYRISKLAAYLLLPYFLWVGFAIYLNYSIVTLN